MRHLPVLLALSFPLALNVPTASAGGKSPLELMRKSEKRHRFFIGEEVTVQMTLQKVGNPARKRTYRALALMDDKSGDKTRVHFLAPANIRGTALLTLERRKNGKRVADDDQWLYLSAFKRTRRIGAADLGDRFMASDIFFEDVQRRQVDDYAYEMKGQEKIADADCYVIESTPKTARLKKHSPYGKTLIWLRKDNLAVAKYRYYDRKMQPLKEVEFKKLVKVTGKSYRANLIVITDIQRKHRTTLSLGNRKLIKKLGRDTFSASALKRLAD